MAKTLPASAFAIDGRVIVTKNSGEEIKGIVKKIIGGENDLLLITTAEGEDKKFRAERVRKARGPAPGSTRTPKASAQTSQEDEDDTETGSDDSGLLDLDTFTQISAALEQMQGLIAGHVAALEAAKKPQTSPKNALAIVGKGKGKGKAASRPLAEDEDED